MRRIAIVGAGQAGLQLALGLQERGYPVTLVSERTPEELRAGPVLSTQVMFGPALALEREAAPDIVPKEWTAEAPGAVGQTVTVAAPPPAADGPIALAVRYPFSEPARAIDQRLKHAHWLELAAERGVRVEYRAVDRAGLAALAGEHELTLVAVGRGELSGLFPRDPERSAVDAPQRELSCLYLHGLRHPDDETLVRINAVPGVGELIVMPGLTLSGPCDMLLWEAVPGGPLDCWGDRPGTAEQLERTQELAARVAPWFAPALASAEPTDPRASLYGRITPVVRRPVAEAAPGRPVLGMADAVVLNDPVAGQGANTAARCADVYLRAVLERGEDGPFDEDWMRDAFERFWSDHARHTTAYTHALLGPPAEHALRAMAAAARHPEVARRLGAGQEDPSTLADWWYSAEATDAYLAEVAGGGR